MFKAMLRKKGMAGNLFPVSLKHFHIFLSLEKYYSSISATCQNSEKFVNYTYVNFVCTLGGIDTSLHFFVDLDK